jgi:hypothetical protein
VRVAREHVALPVLLQGDRDAAQPALGLPHLDLERGLPADPRPIGLEIDLRRRPHAEEGQRGHREHGQEQDGQEGLDETGKQLEHGVLRMPRKTCKGLV